MGPGTSNKYAVLSKLFWLFAKPLFVKGAKATETTFDDEAVELLDQLINSDISFDDINI